VSTLAGANLNLQKKYDYMAGKAPVPGKPEPPKP